MLSQLSGNRHTVCSAIALLAVSGEIVSDFELTDVYFKDVSPIEVENYVDTGEPLDKAGAYGIQDIKYSLVEKIDGCYFNVVGFPATHFYKVWNEINRKLKNDSE